MSSPGSPKPTEREPEETRPDQGTTTPADPEGQGNPDAPEGKVKGVIQKVKEGFDDLGGQKIGAKIGDDPPEAPSSPR